MIASMHTILHDVVEVGVMLMEIIGVLVLIVTAARSVFHLIRKRSDVRLELAEGIALALEFKLGGEVLHTVIVQDWTELGHLGAIVLIRAILTFLLQWEIRNEKKAISEKTDSDTQVELPAEKT